MSNNIVLTAGIRQNLLSLQETAQLQQTTQEDLATGKKVNSALDNAVDYFTSASLSARATELSNLLDSMTNGVNTITAANNGLTSITQTIQSMQATATQALQDASWQSTSYSISSSITTASLQTISFSGGAVGSTAVTVDVNDQETVTAGASYTQIGSSGSTGSLTIQALDINGGNAITVTVGTADAATTVAANINSAAGYALATVSGGKLSLVDAGSNTVTVTANSTATATSVGFSSTSVTSVPAAGATDTVDEIVNAINSNASLAGFIKASNNAGQLQITNLSISSLTVAGISPSGLIVGGSGTSSIGGNAVRANLVNQFNELSDQLNKTAQDASFNGIDLLTGDVLKLFFNETSTSTLSIQSTNPDGVNTTTLGIDPATDTEFQNNTALETRLQNLQNALNQVASQASDFGSNLSIVQNRQDFTTNMINTLQTGAQSLTIADTNEEGADMLALQTRQQLSITALSLASQAQQSVLKLFG
jgi:flagellin